MVTRGRLDSEHPLIRAPGLAAGLFEDSIVIEAPPMPTSARDRCYKSFDEIGDNTRDGAGRQIAG